MKENSLLSDFFGNTVIIKVIDFLIDNRPYDASKIEIVRGSGISRTSLFTNWEQLENNDIVKVSRTFGNTKLYKLNSENVLVKKLLELDMGLMKKHAESINANASKKMLVKI